MCEGWLTGSAAPLGKVVPRERCRLALRSIDVDYAVDASLVDLVNRVTEHIPPAGRQKSRLRASIGMSRGGRPRRCSLHHSLFLRTSVIRSTARRRTRNGSTGLRFGGVQWGIFVDSHRQKRGGETGVFSIASERLNRTSARTGAWCLSRTDFALSAAERQCDIITRADSDRAAALRRWDSERGSA